MQNLLMLDENMHQLRPQSAQSVRKTLWQPRVGVKVLRPTFFHTAVFLFVVLAAFIALLFSSDNLTLCLPLWTEVGISWEGPEHIQYVEPPISPQQSLSIY